MTLKISTLKTNIQEEQNYFESFLIEPFDPGQAITIANALRRTILSELCSFRVTGARINDLKHEFQGIDSIREDTLEVLLNLKEVVFEPSQWAYESNINHIKAFIAVQGPCLVTASMINLPFQLFRITNPSHYICTIVDEGEFYCELDIELGKGYILKEQFGTSKEKETELIVQETATRELEDFLLKEVDEVEEKDIQEKEKALQAIISERIQRLYIYPNGLYEEKAYSNLSSKMKVLPFLGESSTFFLDVNFSPIKSVNFKIRLIHDVVGNLKESLLLDIVTNGSLLPRRAFQEALKILINLFFPLLLSPKSPTIPKGFRIEIYKNYCRNFLRLKKRKNLSKNQQILIELESATLKKLRKENRLLKIIKLLREKRSVSS